MTTMALLHDSIRGIHLLHWLTAAVPLATLVIASGVLRGKATARLLLLGVVMTLATALLYSSASELSQIRYGAPLAMARMGIDPLTNELRTSVTILRACFVADLLFWCSSAVLLGALIQSVVRRIRWLRGVDSRA